MRAAVQSPASTSRLVGQGRAPMPRAGPGPDPGTDRGQRTMPHRHPRRSWRLAGPSRQPPFHPGPRSASASSRSSARVVTEHSVGDRVNRRSRGFGARLRNLRVLRHWLGRPCAWRQSSSHRAMPSTAVMPSTPSSDARYEVRCPNGIDAARGRSTDLRRAGVTTYNGDQGRRRDPGADRESRSFGIGGPRTSGPLQYAQDSSAEEERPFAIDVTERRSSHWPSNSGPPARVKR
jgi:hypothetical protein